MDTALIWMLNDNNPDELTLGAVTAPYGPAVGKFNLPVRGSLSEAALNTKKSLVVEDGDDHPRMNPHLTSRLPHGSLLVEPLLRGGGEPIGVLVLSRAQKGPFSREQMDLADLFSRRVAAVIEMAHLYQQTRDDADTKAMLLRELNHRVKNNLAGIASLLSIGQPHLEPEALQWLNRTIDRISAMAQVHDLFSDGRQRVGLTELLGHTVRSLSVVKPADIVVVAESPKEPTWLRTDRAVSLAMAIHELSSNGIVHGLGESGTLRIRASRNNGDLLVDVEDDAGTKRPAAVDFNGRDPLTPGRKGLGLELVRGLTARELRGQLTLTAGTAGTIAHLQFPLLPDELRAAEL
jgi:two-component sensor histidine kinase